MAETRTRLGTAAVRFEQVDVSDSAAVDACAERLGVVDILLNCAGIGRQTAGENITDASYHQTADRYPRPDIADRYPRPVARQAAGVGAVPHPGAAMRLHEIGYCIQNTDFKG